MSSLVKIFPKDTQKKIETKIALCIWKSNAEKDSITDSTRVAFDVTMDEEKLSGEATYKNSITLGSLMHALRSTSYLVRRGMVLT